MCIFKKHKPYYTGEGYKQIYRPDHPDARDNGYVAEHRVKASEKIGRLLLKDEVVHHINGNKKDNRKKNLQVITKEEHYKIHHSKG